jgi:hypothetical protein
MKDDIREHLRKWGSNETFPKVKYNIAYVVKNCNLALLEALEPWCDRIYIEDDTHALYSQYLDQEQQNTSFDLSKRVFNLTSNDPLSENDIIIEFDAAHLTQENFRMLQQMPEIIKQSGKVEDFELDIFRTHIFSLIEYQNDLIP